MDNINKENVKCWSKRLNVDFLATKSNEHTHTHTHTQAQYILRAKSKFKVDRDSEFGIPNRYGLDGSEIESGGGQIFRTRPDRHWGPLSLPYNG